MLTPQGELSRYLRVSTQYGTPGRLRATRDRWQKPMESSRCLTVHAAQAAFPGERTLYGESLFFRLHLAAIAAGGFEFRIQRERLIELGNGFSLVTFPGQ